MFHYGNRLAVTKCGSSNYTMSVQNRQVELCWGLALLSYYSRPAPFYIILVFFTCGTKQGSFSLSSRASLNSLNSSLTTRQTVSSPNTVSGSVQNSEVRTFTVQSSSASWHAARLATQSLTTGVAGLAIHVATG